MAAPRFGIAQHAELWDPLTGAGLSPGELREALEHLAPAGQEQALRERLFPCAWTPRETVYAVADGPAHQRALNRGLRPKAIVHGRHLLWALQVTFRVSLMHTALWDLAERFPIFASRPILAGWQAAVICGLAAAAVLLALFAPALLHAAIAIVFGILFLGMIGLKILCLLPLPVPAAEPGQEPAPTLLPVYTVMVPLFREVAVIDSLFPALLALDYPEELLDIKIVLEEDDLAMRRACEALRLPAHFEILVVPRGQPQTKPRALCYALQFARGGLVTIFDAEDIPGRDQLWSAAEAFARGPPELACVQAHLSFYNPGQNWLTRQFTIEYAVLFELLLPCLAAFDLPVPLGGTSNHFRTAVLRKVGAWDPFNVTEDADLGIRLARLGYATGVISSWTEEEATFALGNWIRQRARWLKGWAITWLVHMRHPVRLYRDLGRGGFWVTQAVLFGTVVSALLHPVFLISVLWSIFGGTLFGAPWHWPSVAAGGASLAVLAMGYGVSIWAGKRALRAAGIGGWWLPLAQMPIYWLLVSLAAWRALYEMIVSPYSWNKTQHGLRRGKEGRRRR